VARSQDAGGGGALSDGGQPPLGRRAFLGLLGSAAAGTGVAGLLAGCGGSKPLSPRAQRRARLAAEARRDEATFQSRPDLRPPRIEMDRTPPSPELTNLIFTETHGGPGQQGPVVLDRGGRLVWFRPLSEHGTAGLRAFNVRVQSYRGEPVMTWWQGAVVSGHGQGHYELWNQRYRRIGQVHAANGYRGDLHEFVLTDRGTALFTCFGQAKGQIPRHQGPGTRQGAYFYGVVQEIDVATGKLLLQWRSKDHVSVQDSYHLPPPPSPRVAWDYFHVNGISVDPSDQNLLISSRNTWTIYKVHRHTGELIWRLGGKRSDFEIEPQAHFAFQHHITAHPGGLLTIFDNEGGPPREASQSRGLVVKVDERRRRVTFVRQYLHDPAVSSPALGSVQELDGGRMFVGWGDSGYFTEYDHEGRVTVDGRLAGSLSYRAFQAPWAGRPGHHPHVAVKRDGKAAQVYASWNGATQHHRWRVLAGQDPASLTEQAVSDVAGFETAITVPGTPAWLAVEAIDRAGSVIGRTPPRRI
jgi:hypothetical protein